MRCFRFRVRSLLALALALPLAVACSSGGGESGGDGGSGGSAGSGGAPQTELGRQLAGIADQADQYIGANAEAYEGLDFAASALAAAFGGSGAAASVGLKQASCIPTDFQGVTLAYDPPSGVYTSTQIPGAPAGGVRVLVYDLEQGTPTGNGIGNLDVTCTGSLPDVTLTASLTVNEVEIFNLNANGTVFLDSYFFDLSGFLASADGSQRINYGEGDSGASAASVTSTDSNIGVSFTVGERTFAVLGRSIFLGDAENVRINVFKEGEGEFFLDFEFRADLLGTSESVSGPGIFEDIIGGTGAIDAVACFEGTFENMSVVPATESCALGYDFVTLPPADIAAMQRAYDGLRRMYGAVAGVTTAGAAIILEALAEMEPT